MQQNLEQHFEDLRLRRMRAMENRHRYREQKAQKFTTYVAEEVEAFIEVTAEILNLIADKNSNISTDDNSANAGASRGLLPQEYTELVSQLPGPILDLVKGGTPFTQILQNQSQKSTEKGSTSNSNTVAVSEKYVKEAMSGFGSLLQALLKEALNTSSSIPYAQDGANVKSINNGHRDNKEMQRQYMAAIAEVKRKYARHFNDIMSSAQRTADNILDDMSTAASNAASSSAVRGRTTDAEEHAYKKAVKKLEEANHKLQQELEAERELSQMRVSQMDALRQSASVDAALSQSVKSLSVEVENKRQRIVELERQVEEERDQAESRIAKACASAREKLRELHSTEREALSAEIEAVQAEMFDKTKKDEKLSRKLRAEIQELMNENQSLKETMASNDELRKRDALKAADVELECEQLKRELRTMQSKFNELAESSLVNTVQNNNEALKQFKQIEAEPEQPQAQAGSVASSRGSSLLEMDSALETLAAKSPIRINMTAVNAARQNRSDAEVDNVADTGRSVPTVSAFTDVSPRLHQHVDVSKLDRQVEDLRIIVTDLSDENDRLKERLAATEARMHKRERDIRDELGSKYSEAARKNVEAIKQHKEAQIVSREEIANRDEQIARLEADLEFQIKKSKKEKRELQRNVNDRLRELSRDDPNLEQQLDEMSVKNSQLESQLAQLQQQHEELAHERNELQANLARSVQNLTNTTLDRDTLRKMLREEETVQELQSKFDAFRNAADADRARLQQALDTEQAAKAELQADLKKTRGKLKNQVEQAKAVTAELDAAKSALQETCDAETRLKEELKREAEHRSIIEQKSSNAETVHAGLQQQLVAHQQQLARKAAQQGQVTSFMAKQEWRRTIWSGWIAVTLRAALEKGQRKDKDIDYLLTQIEQGKLDHSTEKDQLLNSLNAKSNEGESLVADFNALKKTLNDERKWADELAVLHSGEEEKRQQKEAECERLRMGIQELNRTLSAAETKQYEMEAQTKELQEKCMAMENELNDERDRREAMTISQHQAEQEISELLGQRDSLQSRNAEMEVLKSQYGNIESQLESTIRKLSAQEQNLRSTQNELRNVTSKYEALKEDQMVVQDERDELREQLTQTENDLNKLAQGVQAKEADASQFSETIKQMQATHAEHIHTLNARTEVLEAQLIGKDDQLNMLREQLAQSSQNGAMRAAAEAKSAEAAAEVIAVQKQLVEAVEKKVFAENLTKDREHEIEKLLQQLEQAAETKNYLERTHFEELSAVQGELKSMQELFAKSSHEHAVQSEHAKQLAEQMALQQQDASVLSRQLKVLEEDHMRLKNDVEPKLKRHLCELMFKGSTKSSMRAAWSLWTQFIHAKRMAHVKSLAAAKTQSLTDKFLKEQTQASEDLAAGIRNLQKQIERLSMAHKEALEDVTVRDGEIAELRIKNELLSDERLRQQQRITELEKQAFTWQEAIASRMEQIAKASAEQMLERKHLDDDRHQLEQRLKDMVENQKKQVQSALQSVEDNHRKLNHETKEKHRQELDEMAQASAQRAGSCEKVIEDQRRLIADKTRAIEDAAKMYEEKVQAYNDLQAAMDRLAAENAAMKETQRQHEKSMKTVKKGLDAIEKIKQYKADLREKDAMIEDLRQQLGNMNANHLLQKQRYEKEFADERNERVALEKKLIKFRKEDIDRQFREHELEEKRRNASLFEQRKEDLAVQAAAEAFAEHYKQLESKFDALQEEKNKKEADLKSKHRELWLELDNLESELTKERELADERAHKAALQRQTAGEKVEEIDLNYRSESAADSAH